MREKLWRYVCRNIPEGTILPKWALVFRALLFPIDFFYWRTSMATGYQFESDIWLIGGVRFSARSLRAISKAKGETFKITSVGDGVIVFTRVDG
ncbi:MAG: hypothetical protein ACK5XE_08350 [Burkholderiales bacterium]|jgi:hypothetical protein